MLEELTKFSKAILHQEAEEDLPAEPAILLSVYNGVFTLCQEGREIVINYETIPDLIKGIKLAKQEAIDDGLFTP